MRDGLVHDRFVATERCSASQATVARWLAGAPVDAERPNRVTVVVDLEAGAWAWNPVGAEPFRGPGQVVYERVPCGCVFAAFVEVAHAD